MESPPDNCKLKIGKNIRTWVVTLTGVDGTAYAGEESIRVCGGDVQKRCMSRLLGCISWFLEAP